MDTTDKKKEIIKVLQSLNDEQLIEDVYQLLHQDEAIENISVSGLPAEIQSKITRALDDYKRGDYITHNQMKQKAEQWLMYVA